MSPNPERPVPNAAYQDPLLALLGSGKHLWADEHADEYVNRLRDGWYNNPQAVLDWPKP